jgi:tRNA-specific 2-thiouridylase
LKKKVLVGMSGGIHSAVTAALLQSQGYEVVGVHLALNKGPSTKFPARCLLKSPTLARDACKKLGMPFHAVDLEGQFADQVEDDFVHQILRGEVPNPCVTCHCKVRIQALFEVADKLGCDRVATGHHAQVFEDTSQEGDGPALCRLIKCIDLARDQSHLLFELDQKKLRRLLLPLGGLQRTMIERLVREFALPHSSWPSPERTCLSMAGDGREVVEERAPASLILRGLVKNPEGGVVGEHQGLHLFRVGQKPMINIVNKEHQNLLVTGFDPVSQTIFVGGIRQLQKKEVRVGRLHWIRPVDGLRGIRCAVRLGTNSETEVPGLVCEFENAAAHVEFDSPTPVLGIGQTLAFYENDELLGGAWIEDLSGSDRTL